MSLPSAQETLPGGPIPDNVLLVHAVLDGRWATVDYLMSGINPRRTRYIHSPSLAKSFAVDGEIKEAK